MRNIPDVAMVSANVVVIYNGGSQGTVTGTSIATPLWAAFTALVNQQAALRGQPPIGFLNPSVYSIGNGPSYASAFHDIQTGNNFNSSSPTRFLAVAGYDLCTGWGSPTGSNLINVLAPPVNASLVTNLSASLISESCAPTNGVIDAGETVAVNFELQNVGGVDTTNLVATLLAGGGVVPVSGPQTYGALVGGGGSVTRPFSFTASGDCGSVLTATLQLQDGANSLGSLVSTFQTGVPVIPFNENFDGITAPALPSGWTSATSGGGVKWVTTAASSDSSAYPVFAAEPTNSGVTELVSPAIAISTAGAQLFFRQNYNIEADPAVATKAYDGGVLEVKIGTNTFTDILSAGGSFVSGGYNKTIDPTDDNPLDGRQCWSGLSGGFTTTLVNLPASAASQSIQLKWRFGTDSGNFYGNGGWYVDSIRLADGYTCCTGSPPPNITLQPTNQTVVAGADVAFYVTAAGIAPLTYQWLFTGTNVTGATSSSLDLTNVQPAQSGDYQVVVSNGSGSATSSIATLRILVPPMLTFGGSSLTPTNISVSLSSITGLNYALQYKDSLTDALWTTIPPVSIGTGGAMTLYDTNVMQFSSRFYRVITY
jgi:hypothetical protein